MGFQCFQAMYTKPPLLLGLLDRKDSYGDVGW